MVLSMKESQPILLDPLTFFQLQQSLTLCLNDGVMIARLVALNVCLLKGRCDVILCSLTTPLVRTGWIPADVRLVFPGC